MALQCYIDIETTGLDPRTNQITKISGIKSKRYEIVDIYDQMVNPCMSVPGDILRMTGLNQNILNLCPTINDIRSDFIKFSTNCCLISWGNFENSWLPNKGMAPKCFNAIPEARKILKGKVENFKLITICNHLSIPLRHHRSLSDALALYHICNLLRIRF